MVAVTFDKVRKAFGSVVAIPALDLAIGSGEFVSLLGPSGCGKTTTLRMLAGLEQPSGGRILIGDRVVNDQPPAARDIAMVFQSYALYPHMTVAENIAYPLLKRGVPKAERPAKVKAVADLLQLGPLLDRKPRQLSGGQQQRVALGRALVREPKVFLLDEPLSNLDAKLRAHMRAELIELHRRLGKTMVYVTHDQLEAMTMSTRIAVMQGGELQQFDTPAEIYHRPANRFVASFIGTPAMTLVEGAVAMDNQRHVLHVGELAIALPLRALDLKQASEKVTVGVRPEDVLIGTGDDKALIRIVEPTGHESIVTLNAGGVTFTARVPGDRRLKAGETVPFELRRDNIHVFDQVSGRRLNSHG
ncbi:ABC transporter ATP-binding protein [Taklimakanibacter deserti]|uniref:ABC transporter ATP-binding protein n=1 Tax=Taklimakanibacter deserti TaxID=2267839 RepID=UPI000E659C2D